VVTVPEEPRFTGIVELKDRGKGVVETFEDLRHVLEQQPAAGTGSA